MVLFALSWVKMETKQLISSIFLKECLTFQSSFGQKRLFYTVFSASPLMLRAVVDPLAAVHIQCDSVRSVSGGKNWACPAFSDGIRALILGNRPQHDSSNCNFSVHELIW